MELIWKEIGEDEREWKWLGEEKEFSMNINYDENELRIPYFSQQSKQGNQQESYWENDITANF